VNPVADDVEDVEQVEAEELDEEAAAWRSTPVLIGLVVVFTALAVIGGVLIYQKATTPGAGSVDVGFMQDMTTHHQQAIEMAAIAAESATDPDVRSFAREVLISQQYEIGYMEALLEDWGEWPFPQDRDAMAWMGMHTTPAEMPGMQPDADVAALSKMTGPEVDQNFLRMMTDHHRGGVHMAEDAAENAQDERVRSLAQRMATQQKGEIADYERAAQRLGITID
jgi:uncharacterized protein (DUF305 family)